MPNQDRFRVYRIDRDGGEERQDMIVGHPERGWVCATETTEKRARQWASTYSISDDLPNTYEVREVKTETGPPSGMTEFAIIKYKRGRSFL